ncbi:MAG: Na(+)-translocating NADH-quinone reductase subunit A [Ferruginibacter sp.]
MGKYIKLKRGLNIKLAGEAKKIFSTVPLPETFAVKPTDFIDITPKLMVKEGDQVQAGTTLFFAKHNEDIRFSSPVSGEVIEIVRGEKRKLLEIKILADKEISYLDFNKANPEDLSREVIIEKILNSGAWPFIRQRPFGTIANPAEVPKSIFISAFDSSPLAPDYNFIMQADETSFQTGLNAISKLTDGKLHLNIDKDKTISTVFSNAKGVEINTFSGPHPAGNIGVQVHHIDPLCKGETIWYVNPQDVVIIGKLFTKGRFEATRVLAITGSQIEQPLYYKTLVGSAVKKILLDTGIKDGDHRIISGNVLTGKQIPVEGYSGFYDAQITVIPEGHTFEFMGWLAPGFNKFSMSRSFFSWLNPNKKYDLDTNLHGEERPFVVTGEYEKVFPMDIYPVQLLKSILVEDLDMMEKLGIYEVLEEDFALCEVVCTSKIKSQDIIRKGLEIIRKEFS